MTNGRPDLEFTVDGSLQSVPDDGRSLLEVLRDVIGVTSAKDGCSPQGQCGCCTVLVDGAPRVACVTPVRRVRGRSIVTVDGLPVDRAQQWADAMYATGGSQCGFCTPGIICRLEGMAAKGGDLTDAEQVDKALLAHMCRCTGWQTIREAAVQVGTGAVTAPRDTDRPATRAELEGGAPQGVGPDIALGRGGFADDLAPRDALVAIRSDEGWTVADTLAEARAAAGKVQGRRTTVPATPPLDIPDGDWVATMRTCWVDPAYLEPDAAWCVPGNEPVGPLTNGGAFGGKADSDISSEARLLADEYGRPVRLLLDREEVVGRGPKRPPVAIGVRADGSGAIRVVRTAGAADLIAQLAPELTVEEVDVAGPPTSLAFRAALLAEIEIVRAALTPDLASRTVSLASGARAEVTIDDGVVQVRVAAGMPVDEVVLRSYVMGAAHQALGFVRSEALSVDDAGIVHDLTIRSFGVLRAVDSPTFEVEIEHSKAPPVPVSDAVFAATAAAAWVSSGCPQDLPVDR